MTCRFQPFAVVRLRPTHPDHDRLPGRGAVLMVLDAEDCVYEVEFADDEGRTIDMLAVSDSDLEPTGGQD